MPTTICSTKRSSCNHIVATLGGSVTLHNRLDENGGSGLHSTVRLTLTDNGSQMTDKASNTERVRLDKWLWVARFFKTRGLSADEIGKGRVEVNGQAAKASRELRPGDRVELRQGPLTRTLVVKALSLQRGSAVVAQALYEETPESIALREKQAQERRSGAEPALALEQGRPTKRDRRKLADWNRWSASSDPD